VDTTVDTGRLVLELALVGVAYWIGFWRGRRFNRG
jgi:hypothetical protein